MADMTDGRELLCHCGTCTCNPNMTPAVRFDLSPAQKDGAIRDHLIALGWTPPGAQQPAGVDDDYRRGLAFILSHRDAITAMCAGPSEQFVVERTFDALAAQQQGGAG